MIKTNRLLFLAAAAVLGFTLASCTSGGDAPASDSSGSTAEQNDGTATTDAATEDGDDSTESGDAAAASGPECLVGMWEMTPEAMEEQVLAQTGGEGAIDVEGVSTISFDGETSTTDIDTSSTYSVTVQGSVVEGGSDTNGTIVIGYTADAESITYGDIVSTEGTVSVTSGGTTQDVDIAETAAMMPGQVLTYTCSDTELSLTSTIPVIDAELVQVFTRA